ncbi:MAG: trypsin-like peptidase domain-containing protein [Planctomycetes bacterium]|nr:trypsin-like peptidase domain-containing protein [Planctomycetota bacterium]MBI3846836.1 trypsin-like peptidase domain-containing protein [Planctomycetota bacterium]
MRVFPCALLALSCFVTFGCASTLPPFVVNYGKTFAADAGSPSRFSGSGFVWNGKFMITAAHALPDDRPRIVIQDGMFTSRTIRGEVVVRDSDVALVKLDVPEALPSLEIAPRDLVPGERARILDGGLGSRHVLEATALYSDSLRIEGHLGSIDYGSSGSPIVNDRNEVVGIVFGTIRSGGDSLVSIYTATEIRRAMALHQSYWPVAGH